MKSNALDKKDHADLQKYEAQIEKGQGSFIQVGQALFAIKQRRLYRQSADTFEDYCQERWGWGASRARQICGAVKFWEENKNGEAPKNEREVRRQISDVKKPDDSASDTSDKKRYQGNTLLDTPNIPKEPEIRTDKLGYPIPENLIPEWDRATDQAMGWIRGFDAIHRQIMGIHGTDFAVAKINKSTLESDHSNYRSQLKQAVPYAVCPICQGKIPDKCKGCNPCNEEGKGKGLGWVNQRYWETCVPIELKKIRERAYGTKSPARLST